MIEFGRNQSGQQIVWEASQIINGHGFIAGMSGAGKSHLLRAFATKLAHDAQSTVNRVHVYDIHGDLEMQGESVVSFTEQSEFGLNPLVVNADAEFGGVRRRIQTLLSILNKTSRQLGPKQEAVLRNLLQDLYSANGFYADQPASWTLNDNTPRRYPKKFPTFDDAYRFSFNKLKSMYMGGVGTASAGALSELDKQMQSLRKKLLAGCATEDDKARLEDLKATAIDRFTDYVAKLETGREIEEVIKYDSKDTLKSVVDRLENLRATGILKGRAPPFDASARIWRRKINTLSIDERKLFVLLDLSERFLDAVRLGVSSTLREIIILDEAHAFVDDDPTNPINTIVREARKFGVGILLASQTPSDLPDPVLAQMGTKVILKIDEMYFASAARKLGVEQELLKQVQPRRSALIQMKRPGDSSNRFDHVTLNIR
jgi:Bacterial protein of unknown function (DUF853)